MTIDQLDMLTAKKRSKRKIFSYIRELLVLGIIFGLAITTVTVFTNATLFLTSLKDTLNIDTPKQLDDIKKSMYQDNSISSIIDKQQAKETEIKKMIAEYSSSEDMPTPIAKDTETLLGEHLKGYDFNFNTLPPSNRLIVPKFAVNDPIITSIYTNMDEFIYKNYNEELKRGVVKYPTTPAPGQSGNVLIFGHTSQEWWKENKYGMAFAHISQIQIGDMIQITWEGHLYEYKVVDIQVKYPQHVNETYQQYANRDKNYLTLMGCYPIGTAKQRMLIIAEQVQ